MLEVTNTLRISLGSPFITPKLKLMRQFRIRVSDGLSNSQLSRVDEPLPAVSRCFPGYLE